jgi:hypothetical protein
MSHDFIKIFTAACIASITATGCAPDAASDDETEGDPTGVAEEAVVSASTMLDHPGNAKLRVASWNTDRGSVFPKTDAVWKAIHTANDGVADTTRTENAKAVFKAVDADIWLLQEVAYGGLPAGITLPMINDKIRTHMNDVTSKKWQVECNGNGLCLMARDTLAIEAKCLNDNRDNGYLLKLKSYTNAHLAVANVHFMQQSQADNTATMMKSSVASAKLVAGDFNDFPSGPYFSGALYQTIDDVPTLQHLSMAQVKDSQAIHVESSLTNATNTTTAGYTSFIGNSGGHAIANVEKGNQFDNFFLGSSTGQWVKRKALIVNALLLSKATLSKYSLSPLATTLKPATYASYFSDFATTGTVKPMPNPTSIEHDHLPTVVDIDFPSSQAAITQKLVCP